MFDPENDLQALKDEVFNDPTNIGYFPTITQSVVDGLAKEVGKQVQSKVLVSDLVGIFAKNAAEFLGLVTQNPALGVLATCVCSLGDEKDISAYADNLAELIPGSGIASDVKAMKRNLTRAEVIFGSGSVVGRADWIKARDL